MLEKWMLVCVLIGFAMSLPLAWGADAASALGRKLTDFTNADGKPPTGKDSAADDTIAIRKALAAGPGIVYIPPGFYRWGEVTVPSGVSVVGAGSSTVIRSSGPKVIFMQKGVKDWRIQDLVLDGEAKGEWKSRKDEGHSGILIHESTDFQVRSLTVRNFNGPGIQLSRVSGGWGSQGSLELLICSENYAGLRFDIRAEYLDATRITCRNNVVGCILHAGNVKFSTCNFTCNIDGFFIEDKDNGSHGSISNCLFNHNERYALYCRKVDNGMLLDNCCFFCGAIRLEDCKGINITDGEISCGLEVAGKGVNRIAGNYVIPLRSSAEFTPETIVQDNFTDAGPWNRNNVQAPATQPAGTK